MRLYPRKLKSIKDLKKEKAKLLKQKDADTKVKKKDEESDSKKSGILGIATGLLSSDSLMNLVLSKALPAAIRPKEKVEEANKPSIIFKILKEFVGGYIKWKLFDLAYKGIKSFVRKRKAAKSVTSTS